MKKYSIGEVSLKFNLSKHTLRYYDKINLIPSRKFDNNYRYYLYEDIIEIMYIQVLKFGGFSLKDIKRIKDNRNNLNTCLKQDTIDLFKQKKSEAIKKAKYLNEIISIIDDSIDLINHKTSMDDITKAVTKIFNNIDL